MQKKFVVKASHHVPHSPFVCPLKLVWSAGSSFCLPLAQPVACLLPLLLLLPLERKGVHQPLPTPPESVQGMLFCSIMYPVFFLSRASWRGTERSWGGSCVEHCALCCCQKGEEE